MLGRQAGAPGPDGGESSAAFTREHPLVISATSNGDSATGKIFPLGMWFSSLTKSFRPYATNETFGGKQSLYYRSTPGHNKYLWSHKIVRHDAGKVKKSGSNLQMEQQAFQDNLAPKADPSVFKISGHQYRIERLPKTKNDTPYWVVQVPTAIIQDHEDIFTAP